MVHEIGRPSRFGNRAVRWGTRLLLGLAVGLLAASCNDDNGYCQGGGRCECTHGYGCNMACFDDDCDLYCHDTGDACSAVCGDNCRHYCHSSGSTGCSTSCGDHCSVLCHDNPHCSAECGARSDYECHHAESCGVRVGPGSSVNCHDVNQCIVECEGPCDVTCTSVSDCQIYCSDGRSFRGQGDHTC